MGGGSSTSAVHTPISCFEVNCYPEFLLLKTHHTTPNQAHHNANLSSLHVRFILKVSTGNVSFDDVVFPCLCLPRNEISKANGEHKATTQNRNGQPHRPWLISNCSNITRNSAKPSSLPHRLCSYCVRKRLAQATLLHVDEAVVNGHVTLERGAPTARAIGTDVLSQSLLLVMTKNGPALESVHVEGGRVLAGIEPSGTA